jgi:hypothetical protein
MNDALLVMHEGARISSIYGTYAYGGAARAGEAARVSGYLYGTGRASAAGVAARDSTVPDRAPGQAVPAT